MESVFERQTTEARFKPPKRGNPTQHTWEDWEEITEDVFKDDIQKVGRQKDEVFRIFTEFAVRKAIMKWQRVTEEEPKEEIKSNASTGLLRGLFET